LKFNLPAKFLECLTVATLDYWVVTARCPRSAY
jgi:hypothetical protein